ncbi:MAG: TIR domain-containing protein [Lachnospiraceae bacterium]|nr:TIR domain-containing protein [Lachnospiraceae bacterium]
MSYTYKAFISYRHKPLDSSVAANVQRTIEHYTVPKDLRALTGGKKLGKVFRDEDELPLSSSLSDSIVDALDNSEFLIVICTPDLPLSKWCEQEISHFLRTRDRDHVITVLADGSPDASFSPLLLHTYDEKGNITGDTEPIAANIAADTGRKRRKLFAKEKYRILASLIGCAFDELYKRAQRYQRRRNLALGSAAAAVALSFIGVLLNSNAVIQKNYEQALRNQSMYLASESQRLLDEGDRFAAIALAIEALPRENNERPLISKAEYALAESVNAYGTDWYKNRREGYTINSALKHSNKVRSFMLSENGDLIVSLSQDDIVTAWNTETSSRLWTVQVTDCSSAGLVDVLSDNTVVIYDAGIVYFIDGQSGSVRYKLGGSGDNGFGFIYGALTSKDQKRLAVSSWLGINVFDIESKGEICSIECPEGEKLEILSISDDGSRIAAGRSSGYNSWFEGIRVYDTGSGSIITDLDSFTADQLYMVDVLFAEDNRLCISYVPYYMEMSGTIDRVTIEFFSEKAHYLSLYDTESGNKLWEVASTFNLTNDNYRTLYTDRLGSPAFVNVYSNFVDIVDAGTGDVLTHAEYPTVVSHAEVYNDAVQCITADGGFGGLNAGAQSWSLVYSFVNDIEDVIYDASDYWMVQRGSDSILHYGYRKPDPSWIEFTDDIPDDVEIGYIGDGPIFDKESFAVGASWKKILYFDPDAKEFRYTSLPGGYDEPGEHYTDESVRLKDGVLSLLRRSSNGIYELWNVSMTTEDRKVYAQPEDKMEFCGVIGDSSCEEWYGIVRAYDENWKSEFYFVSFDYEFRMKNKVLISVLDYASVGKFWDNDGSVYVKFSEAEEAYVIDLKSFTVKECSGDFGKALAASGVRELEKWMAYDKASRITAVNTGDRVVLFDKDKAVISEVGDGSFAIISATFAEAGRYLLALCQDNQIRRYDTKTGQLLSRCDVDYDCTYITPQNVSWVGTEKGFTMLMFDSLGAFLVSEDDWDIFTVISKCTAYLPSEDLFVLIPESFYSYKAGGFKRHTAESLVEYGKKILGDWELSETQKMQYGID